MATHASEEDEAPKDSWGGLQLGTATKAFWHMGMATKASEGDAAWKDSTGGLQWTTSKLSPWPIVR
eukprot:5752902-Karenia_brevis.AAC.1